MVHASGPAQSALHNLSSVMPRHSPSRCSSVPASTAAASSPASTKVRLPRCSTAATVQNTASCRWHRTSFEAKHRGCAGQRSLTTNAARRHHLPGHSHSSTRGTTLPRPAACNHAHAALKARVRTCSGSGMPTTLMERRVRRYSSALLTPRRSKQLDWDR